MYDTRISKSKPSYSARFFKIATFFVIVCLLNWGGGWLGHLVNIQIYPSHEPILNFIILGSFLLYTLLVIMPFMPGIEIGLALMMFLGGKGIFLVYLCTLIALSVSYAIGKHIPPHFLAKFLDWLCLRKARDLVLQLQPLNAEERFALLNDKAPKKIVPWLLRHRYLALAILINLPGNALIGDGGGISLIAGMSGIITYPKYILLLSIAILPVPIMIYLNTYATA
jgi:hypothetical protein